MGLLDDAELIDNENYNDEFSAMISPTIIKVIGIGGAGCKAVNRMVEQRLNGVEFMTINTDVQDLQTSRAANRLAIGKSATRGLGAGGDPKKGAAAAEESREEIKKELSGANMVFITAGMGGGTGTGAAPVVASIAKELQILTVAIVTTPFEHEGAVKDGYAREGIDKLKKEVDSIIVIPNRNLTKVLPPDISMKEAFLAADSILRDGILGMSKIISVPGDINIDFADVRAILKNSGQAYIGLGEGKGETRVVDAINKAINNQILDNGDITGARGVIINVEADEDFPMKDFQEICDEISRSVDSKAIVKHGLIYNREKTDTVKITLLAAGFNQADEEETEAEEKSQDDFGPLSSFGKNEGGTFSAKDWTQLDRTFLNGSVSKPDLKEYSSFDADIDFPPILKHR
ncbi:MAG: cell division protein FtsZ [Spirochaetia bacterium]|nr:cell division protein FtsZ [Spirochaetia bacterium]